MYYYYMQSARGIRIWWKKYITILQILQFVIDLGFIYFASYTYFAYTYFKWLPNAGNCAGEVRGIRHGTCWHDFAQLMDIVPVFSSRRYTNVKQEFAAFSGMAIISSYLFLFIGFYLSTYKKPVKKGRGRASSALIEMKDEQIPNLQQIGRRLSGNSVTLSTGKETGTATNRVTRSRKA